MKRSVTAGRDPSHLVIEVLQSSGVGTRPAEIVERKGLGHPDTICDMLSERLSLALSKRYLDSFGLILHHNVDKALLRAGRSEPRFGGGRILEPIEIYLSGRAMIEARGKEVPIRELAGECAREWFLKTMHALDPDRAVRIHCLVRPGSRDLVDLFLRQRDAGVFMANDTSCGAGFAPLTPLEKVVLAIEQRLNSPEIKSIFPAAGEDIKVMGVRERDRIALTISCAFVDRFLPDIGAYCEAKERLQYLARETARQHYTNEIEVEVNDADDIKGGSIFLTVSGTSAEAGDDGQTGRGNRSNGLITPYRPMTLEAVAGKNPVTHVGKLYNLAAGRIASAIVAEVPGIAEAECFLVSQIGTPVDRPRLVHLRVRPHEREIDRHIERSIGATVERELSAIPKLWQSLLAGDISAA